MSNVKISALPTATASTSGDFIPIVQSGVTDKITYANFIAPRVGSTTSSATPTINTDNVDVYKLTAQAADITSFTTNLSGTPVDSQLLWLQITGTGNHSITWGASFESSVVVLPTAGAISTSRTDILLSWNATTSKWRCISVV